MDQIGNHASAMGPLALLEESAFMCMGPLEANGSTADIYRAVQALKYCATTASGPIPGQNSVHPSQNVPPEDPLVSQIVGGIAPKEIQNGVIHHGFTCDGCQMFPLNGSRFKATNKIDHDICMACRTAGNFAGGKGFVCLTDATAALRFALQSVLDWWPLVWADRSDLFAQTSPGDTLASMSLGQLQQAVMNLPDQ